MPKQAEIPSLADADWLRREEMQALFNMFERAGFPALAVGGAVRNSLVGMAVADIDIATPAKPAQVIAACRDAGLSCVPTGVDHGTVTVTLNRVAFEVTTLRRDVSTDGRRATVEYTSDWGEDAARRDFTVNALYCDRHGSVLDPLGGYPDVAAGAIRFIGDPDQRIAEDYLRILRFFRFFAMFGKGRPHRSALDACVRGRAGLRQLSAERVRSEVMKLLVSDRVMDAIEAMQDFGLLSTVLGCAPRPNVLRRLCDVEQAFGAGADPMLRLSALAVSVEEDAENFRTRLRLSNHEFQSIVVVCRASSREVEALDDVAARQSLYRWRENEWRRRVIASTSGGADQTKSFRKYQLARDWKIPRFPVRGSDVLALGMSPGPQVGALLKSLEEWWVAADFPSEDVLHERLAAHILAM